MEQITVRIKADGSLDYDVKGVKGGKCKDLTKLIDQIAGKVLETQVTGEFCEQPIGQQQQQGR